MPAIEYDFSDGDLSLLANYVLSSDHTTPSMALPASGDTVHMLATAPLIVGSLVPGVTLSIEQSASIDATAVLTGVNIIVTPDITVLLGDGTGSLGATGFEVRAVVVQTGYSGTTLLQGNVFARSVRLTDPTGTPGGNGQIIGAVTATTTITIEGNFVGCQNAILGDTTAPVITLDGESDMNGMLGGIYASERFQSHTHPYYPSGVLPAQHQVAAGVPCPWLGDGVVGTAAAGGSQSLSQGSFYRPI